MLYWLHLAWVGFELTTSVVIGTDCIGSCKSNYHTITTMTAPKDLSWVKVWPKYNKTSLNFAVMMGALTVNAMTIKVHCIYLRNEEFVDIPYTPVSNRFHEYPLSYYLTTLLQGSRTKAPSIKKNVVRLYDYFIMGVGLSGGFSPGGLCPGSFCPVPVLQRYFFCYFASLYMRTLLSCTGINLFFCEVNIWFVLNSF